ncbi:prepilin peptidase [Nocardioides oleivorans]|uniref:Prepilin peptidase n=1 Tax=Nocardioides oleivorans TaxID=273676 RepID=A0A4Q2S1X2_9ACTN|nr:A24 family peptidase [Nocardioides oleivorans]RYB95650.1 prepilin peptidase [Nocardioides oleivorans]
MSDTLLAVVLGAVVAGLGGLLVPTLVGRLPEPDPVPEEKRVEEEPEKVPYVDLAARPGLAWRSAVVAALAGGLLGWAFGLDWPLLWLVPLTPVAVALAVVDWHTRLLPRVVVVPATLAAIALVVVVGLATGEREAVVRALVAMVVSRSFFWVLWFLRSAGMGFGDVRLAAPVGLVLGWTGWDALLLGLWIGFVAFVVPAVGLVVARRDRSLLKKSFPFGPFMLVGALVGLVWGTALAGSTWG